MIIVDKSYLNSIHKRYPKIMWVATGQYDSTFEINYQQVVIFLILTLAIMKRIGSLLLSSVKYAAYLGSITMVGGAAFLGYINSKIGGIEINKDETTKYYHETLGMDKGEAARMYYWLLWDIGMMRVLTYGSYTTYC